MELITTAGSLVYTARAIVEFIHLSQKYGDGKEYMTHLQDVVNVLIEFNPLIAEIFIIAAYFHDAIEDTAVNLKTIEKYFGEKVRDLVYAVTNERGRTPEEVATKTYIKLRSSFPEAIVIKLADRISNVRKAKINADTQKYFKKYQDGYEVFRNTLYQASKEHSKMWAELDKLLDYEGDFI